MSSPSKAADGSTGAHPPRQGFSKALHRIKSTLRPGKQKAAGEDAAKSSSSSSASAAPKATAATSKPPTKRHGTKAIPETMLPDTSTAPRASSRSATTARGGSFSDDDFVHIQRRLSPAERIRLLCDKYGTELADAGSHASTLGGLRFSDDRTAPSEGNAGLVQRVEKPIRMRVRYACHLCETKFVSLKVCSKCEHTRCYECPRSPKRKDRETRRRELAESRGKAS